MSWKAFELPKLPAGVDTAVGSVSSIVGALTAILQIVKAIADLLAKLDLLGLSPAQLIIKAAVAAIEAALEALLKDTGVYLLLVPVSKRIVIPPVVAAALDAAGLKELPPRQLSGELLQVQASLASTGDAATAQYFTSAMGASAGNKAFLRAVIESMYDEGDSNRPQLDPNDHVAGIVVIAGATDVIGLMSFVGAISSLIAPGNPGGGLTAAEIPVPQGLRAKSVASKTGFAVRLEWQFQQPLVSLPTLDLSALVTQVAIIRSKSSSFYTKRTPAEVFGSSKLSKGMKAGVGDEQIEVLDIVDYTGLDMKSSYLDDTKLDHDKAYYYAVSFNITLGSETDIASGGGDERGFLSLSNVAKVAKEEKPVLRSGSGTAPDWIRTPRVIDILPDLGFLIRQLTSLVAQFGNFTSGFGDMLKGYVKYLEQEIENFEQMVETVNGVVTRLSQLSLLNVGAGAYARTFAGTGGTEFFANDLTQSLSPDNTDPKRPPFDHDEFTAGMVILAAAPSADGLVAVQAMLSELFGSSEQPGPLQAAIDQIDVVLAEAEQKFFGDDMRTSGKPKPTVQALFPPRVGADDDGVKDVNCPAPLVSSVTFGDDFAPQT